MCGIAGIITSSLSFNDRSKALHRMNQTMIHRGPDDEGEFHGKDFSLGHRRLSIIDTSPNGRQPIANEDKSLLLVANGEIYNYQELGLKLLDHTFCSETDTEPILHLYEEKGIELLKDLRGMFAFGLMDQNLSRLLLARDRLGIKPVYYAQISNGIIFASEVKSILASGLVEKKINLNAVDSYLSFGYVPCPDTLIEGIKSLPPSHYLLWSNNHFELKRYWDFPEPSHVPLQSQLVLTELQELLKESLKLHSISEVPLGAFLSGGIDSSAIVGLLAPLCNQPIKTFSIGFDSGKPELNELNYASIVSKKFKTDHSEIIVRGKDVLKNIDSIVDSIDQPSFDGINSYLISKAARNGGLTVALSGLGGDELFGGYEIFRLFAKRKKLLSQWYRMPSALRKAIIRMGSLAFKNSYRKNKLRRFQHVNNEIETYAAIRLNLLESDKKEIWLNRDSDFLQTNPVRRLASLTNSNGNVWSMISRLEMQNYMNWRLLRDTDVMSMAHSLEVRVPLIDHKLVEYVCQLPVSWPNRWGFPKLLLTEALSDILPREILDRPKQGFQFPMEDWMRKALKPIVDDTFSEESVKKRGLFSHTTLGRLYKDFQDGAYPYEVIWQFSMLELWMRRFLDEPTGKRN